jgi:hypothetical protein
LPVFDGRALALDETAEVKEEDVRNKSKSKGSSNSIIVLFTFVIITVKMMNKMLLE